MKQYVVDCSTAIKWYIPEDDSELARQFRNSADEMHSPDFIDVEISAVLTKLLRKKELSESELFSVLRDFRATSLIKRVYTGILIDRAVEISISSSRSIYDCLYIALAERLNVAMVTADEKLVNALASTAWRSSVILLKSFSPTP